MTASEHPRVHRLFNFTISSDIDFGLLERLDSADHHQARNVISFTETPAHPHGDKVLGFDELVATMYRDGETTMLSLNTTGWLATLERDNPTVTLCPDSRVIGRGESPMRRDSRELGDRIVTGVLPFLPSVWGGFAIHGSCLSTPFGGVLLLGQSGFGKSTISQYLQRLHGWEVLDDDTSMIDPLAESPVLHPMGALSRLRNDAALELGVELIDLPDYKGRKGAVQRINSSPDRNTGIDITAVVSLQPAGSRHVGAPGELSLSPVSPEKSILPVFEGVFSLFPDHTADRGKRFQTAAKWSSVSSWTLHYDKTEHSAKKTAQFLGEQLKAQTRN